MSQSVLDSVVQTTGELPERRVLDRLLSGLDELADGSDHLFRKSLREFVHGSQTYALPRYIYLGPRGGGDLIRIGIFAAIHGDEPQGALAVTRLAAHLDQHPELAKGYALFFYPACNPSGLEDNTRHSRSGRDLNREFWKNSPEPEVQDLETEIWTHAFHGIVNLHSDDTSHGLYGFANGEVLSRHLLEPALAAAERFLPRNRDRRIDGFAAEGGIIYESYEGVLRAPAGLNQPPFELTLETPHTAPMHLQVEALTAALETILTEYRSLLAIAQNI
ncbi:MAG: succinylglutamate desuccinylase/aspartoacylase family protein [Verrucomicrobiota bacterium]